MSVVFDDLEQRVVAKAVGAARFEANPPTAHIVAFSPNHSGGIGHRDVANVVCRAFLERRVAKLSQQPAIVGFIDTAGTLFDFAKGVPLSLRPSRTPGASPKRE